MNTYEKTGEGGLLADSSRAIPFARPGRLCDNTGSLTAIVIAGINTAKHQTCPC
jgi:hypothetical protein